MLEAFFSRKLQKQVQGRRTTGDRAKMIPFYNALHLQRFQWENTTEFYAWLKAEEGPQEDQSRSPA